MTEMDLEYEMIRENYEALMKSCMYISPQGGLATIATFIEEYSEFAGIPMSVIKSALDASIFADLEEKERGY